jgi:hypothetical protein
MCQLPQLASEPLSVVEHVGVLSLTMIALGDALLLLNPRRNVQIWCYLKVVLEVGVLPFLHELVEVLAVRFLVDGAETDCAVGVIHYGGVERLLVLGGFLLFPLALVHYGLATFDDDFGKFVF